MKTEKWKSDQHSRIKAIITPGSSTEGHACHLSIVGKPDSDPESGLSDYLLNAAIARGDLKGSDVVLLVDPAGGLTFETVDEFLDYCQRLD